MPCQELAWTARLSPRTQTAGAGGQARPATSAATPATPPALGPSTVRKACQPAAAALASPLRRGIPPKKTALQSPLGPLGRGHAIPKSALSQAKRGGSRAQARPARADRPCPGRCCPGVGEEGRRREQCTLPTRVARYARWHATAAGGWGGHGIRRPRQKTVVKARRLGRRLGRALAGLCPVQAPRGDRRRQGHPQATALGALGPRAQSLRMPCLPRRCPRP